MGNDLKLYSVEFEPIWPVGSCLILLAYDEDEAKRIASKTIQHTVIFTVEEVATDEPKVVIYLNGDY